MSSTDTVLRARRSIGAAASDFLSQHRIAVTGVSRDPQGAHGANVVYQRLLERGYDAIAVNPNATAIADQPCYPDLHSIPGGIRAVVIGTRPERAEATVRECIELGVAQIWMHHSIGGSSASREAAVLAREHGIEVIEGGCPLMFDPVSDGGHKAMRFVLSLTGTVPRRA